VEALLGLVRHHFVDVFLDQLAQMVGDRHLDDRLGAKVEPEADHCRLLRDQIDHTTVKRLVVARPHCIGQLLLSGENLGQRLLCDNCLHCLLVSG